ncbi:hypothetical protein GWK47_017713 [Chionoecetes opilio]|uniref:Uncharacterized protein n=1 Tax=Chionoecetes opilio TaxID=41210 RepID=A0A8J5CLZ3_CHIOP|nr:hypothetical protein GWK47_017713 [Chionoecetes opilio]
MNVAERFKEQVIRTNTIPWPPYIHELEKEEDSNELLLKLITWLKNPNNSAIDDSQPVRSIASILTSYITGKRTAFEIDLSVLLHGLTKSTAIVDIMHNYGLGISYNDRKGKPTIAIVDNDDFKSNTLTGSGQSHRTNVMFVQPESFDPEHPSQNPEDRPVLGANFAGKSLDNSQRPRK